MRFDAILQEMGRGAPIDPSCLDGLVPHQPMQHAIFAAVLFVSGRTDQANHHIEIALRRRPDLATAFVLAQGFIATSAPDRFGRGDLHPWFALQWLIGKKGDATRDAVEAIAHVSLRAPFDQPICKTKIFEQVCEGRLQRADLRDPAAAGWLDGFLATHGTDAPVGAALYRACLDHVTGDRAKAACGFHAYWQAQHLVGFGGRGAASYLADAAATPWAIKNFRLHAKAQGQPIIFASDALYLAEWRDLVLECLAQAPAHVSVHFHVVSDEDIALPDTQGVLAGRVGFSQETDPGIGKAYYAASRFLVAGRLLDIYACPILISDIDAAFDPAIAELLKLLETVPAAFLRKEIDSHFPWRSISAGLCYLRPDEGCHRFLDCIARYLAAVFSRDLSADDLWWSDQNALAFALGESGLAEEAVSFFEIRRKFKDFPVRFALNHIAKKKAFRQAEMARIGAAT